MPHRKRANRTALAGVILLLAALANGCSDDDRSAAVPTATSQPAMATPTATLPPVGV